MDQQHLLVTLLTQDEGLIPQLMQKVNVNVNGLLQAAENEVKKLPRATGGQTYVCLLYTSTAVFAGIILYHEPLNMITICSMIAILLAVFISNYTFQKRRW